MNIWSKKEQAALFSLAGSVTNASEFITRYQTETGTARSPGALGMKVAALVELGLVERTDEVVRLINELKRKATSKSKPRVANGKQADPVPPAGWITAPAASVKYRMSEAAIHWAAERGFIRRIATGAKAAPGRAAFLFLEEDVAKRRQAMRKSTGNPAPVKAAPITTEVQIDRGETSDILAAITAMVARVASIVEGR